MKFFGLNIEKIDKTPKKFSDKKARLDRDEIIKRSRILIIDDEKPAIIQDLKNSGFAVDYMDDFKSSDVSIIERRIFDLVILDFGGVAVEFGNDEGLDLLRHIKRVSPSTKVLAYTSKSLTSSQGDFYKISDATLEKDAGIQETLEIVEETLKTTHSLDSLWDSLCLELNITKESQTELDLQNLIIRASEKKENIDNFMEKVNQITSSETTRKVAISISGKILEILLKKSLGA